MFSKNKIDTDKAADRILQMSMNSREYAARKGFMPVEERRFGSTKRTRCHYNAMITLSNGETVDCIVANYSEAGARLKFTTAQDLPKSLVLTIPDLDFEMSVGVRWQKSYEAGVVFRPLA